VTKEKTKNTYRTHQIVIKKGHRMYAYFTEMTEKAKNMYNTTNFFIRQTYTGLKAEYALHPLQQEVLTLINKNVDKMNDVQLIAYQKRLAKEKMNPVDKRKEVKSKLFSAPSEENPYVEYDFLDALFKLTVQNDYRALPTQCSQSVMKTVFQNWKSFYASLKDYRENPHKYKAAPRIPKYSQSSQKEILFTNQDCVVKNDKYLKFPKTKLQLNIGKLGLKGKLKQVRVIPKYGMFTVELVMEPDAKKLDNYVFKDGNVMAIDIGIDNLATIVTNTGRRPVLFKGKHVKSINQYYNKKKAHFIGILRQGKQSNQGPFTSKRLERLHKTRHQKLKDIFHKVSRQIVDIAVEEKIGTIIIGHNKDWKQEINIGKRNNQSFVSIPHSLLIEMITYKAIEYGIETLISEESYTSKASFIDNDEIPVYGKKTDKKPVFSGRRIKRGLYRTKSGVLINADVNGAANILRKAWTKLLKRELFLTESVVWKYAAKK